MRIAIIGGSAFSTPNLLRALAGNQGPHRTDIVLASRSASRLDAVQRASRQVSDGLDINTEVITENTWPQILEGADCVLIQIRVGGYEGRSFDETFGHQYGLCGDEGLGASALSVGWRTWPVIADILQRITKLCPRAFVILMTSPLSLLVRAACKETRLNLVGICELPWTTLQNLDRSLKLPVGHLQADYLGLNHLGWFFNLRADAQDLTEEVAIALGEGGFPTGTFLRTHRCLPTRYLRLHYEREKVLAEQLSQKAPRAAELRNLQEEAYRAYREGSATTVAAALDARRTPWYAEAVAPLLLALNGQPSEVPFFLSVRNNSYTNLLHADDVVECSHRWAAGALQRIELACAPPEEVAKTLPAFARFERVATEAVMQHSLPLLVESLSLHPWTCGHPQLKSIANDIVSYNQSWSLTAAH
jgi:6-phospho-beta-glucosidase